jgi:hypothetical protein
MPMSRLLGVPKSLAMARLVDVMSPAESIVRMPMGAFLRILSQKRLVSWISRVFSLTRCLSCSRVDCLGLDTS